MLKRVWIVLLLVGLLAACGGNGESTDESASDAGSSETTFEGGQNDNGTFFRGEANAPVTFIDYSDYL